MKSWLSALLPVVLLTFLAPLRVTAGPQANTYVVNVRENSDDAIPGDGVCRHDSWSGDYCSLRAAIQEANADEVDSIIRFGQKFSGGNFINSCQMEPIVADHTTLDASDQWDTMNDRPGVELTCGGDDILWTKSNGNVLRGLLFGGTDSIGIRIYGGHGNLVGGEEPHQRNVFIGGTGVVVEQGGTDNVIVGNYFGTINGTSAVGSKIGVTLQDGSTRGNLVAGNLIVGHTQYGVFLWYSAGNGVTGNIVGANSNLTAPLANATGILVEWAEENVIGPYNWIMGSTADGVYVHHSTGTTVHGNTIGDCSNSLGSAGPGIRSVGGSESQIINNSIRCNGGEGIYLSSGFGHVIQGNGISGNGTGGSAKDGVRIEGAHDLLVGGSAYGERNTVGTNGGAGVHLTGSNTYHVQVIGNHVGLSSGAFDAGNKGYGVLVDGGAHDNTVGGSGPGQGNWVAYNDMTGIRISGSSTYGNTVVGNVVGAPINWGWEAGNGHHGIDIYDQAHHNAIGSLGVGNIVLDSGWSGVVIVNSSNNTVWFNAIGTDGADVHWGNHYYGVVVVNGSDNVISFNEVAYSGKNAGQAGVYIDGAVATGNQVRHNSIHANGGAGIELVNGGNNSLPAPVITHAGCRAGLQGQSCANCLIDIFSDSEDEGRVYEGTAEANEMGQFTWAELLNGPNVTATATDPSDNTSPFSASFFIGECNTPPSASFTFSPANPMSGDACTTFSFDASATSDGEDPSSSLQVCWDWDNNGACNTDWTTTKTATYRLGLPTLHAVRLVARDTWERIDATTRVISLSGRTCGLIFLPLVVR